MIYNKQYKMEGKENVFAKNIIQETIKCPSGTSQTRKYMKVKSLGKGGFAKCVEAINLETKQQVALKIVAKSTLNRSKTKQKLISEIKIHKLLRNQYVVRFKSVFEDEQNVYMVLQLCSNNTLNELVKRRKKITQLEAKYFLSQIIQGLKYLRHEKIIHRDLKLGNLFLNENMQIKIGDFGLASRIDFDGQKKKTICGTPNYIAPEILQSKGHSYEVDIWSIGVILFVFLFGKPPFQTTEVKTTYRKIKECNYTMPDYINVTQEAKDLIRSILVLDPSKRPTLQEIQNHPFMKCKIPEKLTITSLYSDPFKTDSEQSGTNVTQKKNKFGNEKQKCQQKAKEANIYNQIEIQNNNKQRERIQNEHSFKNEVYVKTYVDFSNKYGLGYSLSNGSYGVMFNDSSKIVIDRFDEEIHYIEKNDGVQKMQMFEKNKTNGSKELEKKITLLGHFRGYLQNQCKESKKIEKSEEGVFYLKKWLKTKNAFIFRLNNRIVQTKFVDNSELILSSEQKIVTYINTKGEKFRYMLSNALEEKNPEMVKRLKYTKEVLTHLANGGQIP